SVAFVGHLPPRDRAHLHGIHAGFRISACTWSGRALEGPRAGAAPMKAPGAFRSGKTYRDENFPVASRLIPRRHRDLILAFYEFGRTADDIADHPSLRAQEKLDLLDRMEGDLLGFSNWSEEASALRRALAERELAPHHAQDLLKAFRLDVVKHRYADWNDL